MKFKRTLKHIARALILSTLFSGAILPASALTEFGSETFPSPGLQSIILDSGMVINCDKATVNGKSILFETGGKTEFDFLLPFESETMTVSYSLLLKDVNLTIETDSGNTYVNTLSKGSEKKEIPFQEWYGSIIVKISADAPLNVKDITITKINEQYPSQGLTDTEYTDYQYEMLNAVVYKMGASAAKSHGAMHWLDIDDRLLTPLKIEGKMYVPLKTFANELSLYCEDYADKNYILLRDKYKNLVLFGGKGYMESDFEGKIDAELDVVYKDGRTWVPLRALAEMFGYYVEYKDGYAVVDDRLTAKNILADEAIFAELIAEMSEYIVPAELSRGTTYHVAKTSSANDSNPGTADAPFLTINKAGMEAKAGDTVIVHGGTYREEFTPQNDGEVFAPIRFKAAEGEKVVISALETITTMIDDKNLGLWVGVLPDALAFGRNQLFYKGKAIEAGRHPNTHTSPRYREDVWGTLDSVWPTVGNISIKEEGSNVATSDTDLDYEDNYWKGGTFVTHKGYAWTMVSGDIISSTKGEIVLKDHEESRSYNLGLKPSAAHNGAYFYTNVHPDLDWGYITNHIHTVDMPGEWYVDKEGVAYLMPPEGARINKDIEYKVRQRTVNLNNRKYIILDGIDTIGGGITLYGEETKGCILKNGNFKYLGHTNRYTDPQTGFLDTDIEKYGNDNLTTPERFDEGPVEKGELGIYISGYNNSVVNSTVNYCAGAGITLAGSYAFVDNNNVMNCGYMPGYLNSIKITGVVGTKYVTPRGGHFIINNDIKYASRSCIGYGGVYEEGDQINGMNCTNMPSEIAYNHMSYYGIGAIDTGAFYNYGSSTGNDKAKTTLHHNIFDKPVALDYRSVLAAIYNDNMSTAMESYRNLSLYDIKDYMNSNIENTDFVIGKIFQNRGGNPSATRINNNREFGWIPGGLESLNMSDYPGGKAFNAGSSLNGDERFMINYNELSSGVEKDYLPVNVSNTEDNTAKVYRFENVNLPSNGINYLTLYFKLDSVMDTAFFTDVKVYDGSNLIAETSGSLSSKTRDIWWQTGWWEQEIADRCITLPEVKAGKYTVEITAFDKAIDIYRIRADKQVYVDEAFSTDSVLEPGSWDSYSKNCNEGHIELGRSSTIQRGGLYTRDFKTIMSNTWDYTIAYRNRTLKDTVYGIDMVYTTGGEWAGSELEIYVDSLTSEPIGTATLSAHPANPNGWIRQNIQINFTQPVESGTHTFYLKFNGCGKCSTIYEMTYIKGKGRGTAE